MREFGSEKLWVPGYSNDAVAYIPSLRVPQEGGYEAGAVMVCYVAVLLLLRQRLRGPLSRTPINWSAKSAVKIEGTNLVGARSLRYFDVHQALLQVGL